MKKDPMAVALGRRGGKAKNARLTPEQREEMMEQVRAARWPEKRHSFDCPREGRKVTIPHEHI